MVTTRTPAPNSEPSATWWMEPLLGVLSIVVGVLVLARPGDSLKTLAVVLGIFVVLDSIYELAISFGESHESRGLSALVGVLGIIAGILLIRHPVTTVSAIALILGIWLVVHGVVRLVATFAGARSVWSLVLGPLQIVAGIVIVSSPGIGLTAFAWVAGIAFVLNGIVLIAVGFVVRSQVPSARAAADLPEPAAAR